MSEVEQRRDAGMDARGRATQARAGMPAVEQRQEQLPRAVAEQLPSDRARNVAGAPQTQSRGDAAKIRRSAWLLALLAVAFYLGFIAWNVLRAPLGG